MPGRHVFLRVWLCQHGGQLHMFLSQGICPQQRWQNMQGYIHIHVHIHTCTYLHDTSCRQHNDRCLLVYHYIFIEIVRFSEFPGSRLILNRICSYLIGILWKNYRNEACIMCTVRFGWVCHYATQLSADLYEHRGELPLQL